MPRGGARENSGGKRIGAGRPAGPGWRGPTSDWRQSAAEHAAELIGSDRDPLLFLIDRTFDETVDLQTRVSCASIATKYLHPTLSASSVAASHTITRIDAGELLTRVAERIAKQALQIEHVPEAPEAPEPAAVLP